MNGVSAAASASVFTRYPAGSIQSIEAADEALVEAGQERAGIEVRFVLDERACYPKFFATLCVDEAKERRRAAFTQVHAIEVEAKLFKRRIRVLERDKALLEKREQEESEAPQRLKLQIENEVRAADKMKGVTREIKTGAAGDTLESAADKRSLQHEVRLERMHVDERGSAKKRAENVSVYEKKVHDVQLRQREIALKKSEKERERIAAELPVTTPACCAK